LRKAGKQGAIVSEQREAAVRVGADFAEIFLQEPQFEGSRDDAQEFAVGGGDFANQIGNPASGSAVANRLAQD
jgi:hypothetical protein